MKQVDKDIHKTIVPELKPLSGDDKTHDDVCRDYVQKQFEKHPTGQEGLKCSDGWEHSHLHTFMVYKMYYNGEALDAGTPPAVDPNPYRVVPKEKVSTPRSSPPNTPRAVFPPSTTLTPSTARPDRVKPKVYPPEQPPATDPARSTPSPSKDANDSDGERPGTTTTTATGRTRPTRQRSTPPRAEVGNAPRPPRGTGPTGRQG